MIHKKVFKINLERVWIHNTKKGKKNSLLESRWTGTPLPVSLSIPRKGQINAPYDFLQRSIIKPFNLIGRNKFDRTS